MQEVTIQAPIVVGTGEGLTALAEDHKLSHGARVLKRVTNEVALRQTRVGYNNVVVIGAVRKNAEYQTTEGFTGSNQFTVPFECCLHVCGARPGDKAELIDTEIETTDQRLRWPYPSWRLTDKICVRIQVRVTRPALVTMTAGRVQFPVHFGNEIDGGFCCSDHGPGG